MEGTCYVSMNVEWGTKCNINKVKSIKEKLKAAKAYSDSQSEYGDSLPFHFQILFLENS